MRITARAVEKIRRILDEEAKMIAEENYVPAIGWVFNRKGEDEDPGPVLCFFERSQVVRMQPYGTSDLLIYDSLPTDMALLFADCELDLIAGNLNFVRNNEIVRAGLEK